MNTCPDGGCETEMVLCYECHLAEIERQASATAQPRTAPWDALRGAAPGATGKLSSEAFVRQQRDEWNR